MGCSRRRRSRRGTSQPCGKKLSRRFKSTLPSQEMPRRCLSESISRSRWLSTGHTGTQEPHITHSSVKRATRGVTSSEIVARLRSAILTSEDMGTGQARIQRSQPMHISISKRTSSSVNGRRSARCWMPTSGASFFDDDFCIASSLLTAALCSRRQYLCCLFLPHRRPAIGAKTRCTRVDRAAGATLHSGRSCRGSLRAGVALHIDKVECEASDAHAVAVRQAIGIIDLRAIDHHAVNALHVANIVAIGTVEYLGVQARGGYIGQHNVIGFLASHLQTLALFQAIDSRFAMPDQDKRRGGFEGIDNCGRDSLCRARQQERAIGVEYGLALWRRRLTRAVRIVKARQHLVKGCRGCGAGQSWLGRGKRFLPIRAADNEEIWNLPETKAIILHEQVRAARFQAFLVHKGAIGTAQVAQHVLPVGVADLGMAARDRTVIYQEVGSRLASDADNLRLAEGRFTAQIRLILAGSIWKKKGFNQGLRFQDGRRHRATSVCSLAHGGVPFAAHA